MTIDEAIEILTHPFPRPPTRPKGTYNQAIKLGIEALKRIQQQRIGYGVPYDTPLPGETEGDQ